MYIETSYDMKGRKQMLNDLLAGQAITHTTLASLFPFYCCWLDDGTGQPEPNSVMMGPLFFAVHPWASPLEEPWKN
tara:strand:- start:240 stop:467 length:228 start_codon:yes stop_codon:yes gene_type:complete